MSGLTLQPDHHLTLKKLGIDTYQESVIYMRQDCLVCRAEGFEAQASVRVVKGELSIMATLNVVTGPHLLGIDEAGLSESAWRLLKASEGDQITVHHPEPLESLSWVRAKVHGKKLEAKAYQAIVTDIVAGSYSDVHLSSFITACAGNHMDEDEMVHLTRAMVQAGDQLDWKKTPIMDKHCVGGLPGNRTTLIVVPIVTAFGLIMPKTSSRAITSPAGTADVMEVLAPVDLDLKTMQAVVEKEGGCIAWGGAIRLSPADDILIRVERPLDLDSQGQLVASILSKKVAAGSTHVVIDMPVGSTAKVRSPEAAQKLGHDLIEVGKKLGLHVRILITEGEQPVGFGVGPALEALDCLAVLQNKLDAPQDLKERALSLAGVILEFSGKVASGQGRMMAAQTLESGKAWDKFQKICAAQGGLKEPLTAKYQHVVKASKSGRITRIDNRRLARTAKLAGAPKATTAGLLLHVKLDDEMLRGDKLFTVHAQTPGELEYAVSYLENHPDIYQVTEE